MKTKMRKIYNEITLGWNEATQRYDEVLYEDSFQYGGEIDEAMPCQTAFGFRRNCQQQFGPSCPDLDWVYEYCMQNDQQQECQNTGQGIPCHILPDYSYCNVDSTCTWYEPPDPVYGCTDSNAENFNPDATVDNGTCEYLWPAGSVGAEVITEQLVNIDASNTQDPETSVICEAAYQDGMFDHFSETNGGDCLQFVWTYIGCEGNCNELSYNPSIPYSVNEQFGHGETSISFTAPFVQNTQTGKYNFSLSVTDPEGEQAVQPIQILVNGINHPTELELSVNVTDFFGTTTYGPTSGTSMNSPLEVNAKSGDEIEFFANLSDVDGTVEFFPAVVSSYGQCSGPYFNCQQYTAYQGGESIGCNDNAPWYCEDDYGPYPECIEIYSGCSAVPQGQCADPCTWTEDASTYWEITTGTDIGFDDPATLNPETNVPYIVPGTGTQTIDVHFAAADQPLTYGPAIVDGYIEISVSPDEAPYSSGWEHAGDFSAVPSTPDTLLPGFGTTYLLRAYDDNDCPEQTVPHICYDCSNDYIANFGCLNYSNFSISATSAHFVDTSTFLNQYDSDRIWPTAEITMVTGAPGEAIWKDLYPSYGYCPDIGISAQIQDQYTPEEEETQTIAVGTISTICPPVWDKSPEQNPAYWTQNMNEDEPVTVNKFKFWSSINPNGWFFSESINAPEGFTVVNNGYVQVGSEDSDQYYLSLHVTPPPDVSGEFDLSVSLTAASPAWSGDLSATLTLDVGAVIDYDDAPDLMGEVTGVTIEGETEVTTTMPFDNAVFSMDQRSAGQFEFYVYDTDDDESISFIVDRHTATVSGPSWSDPSVDQTWAVGGPIPCTLTSSHTWYCRFNVHFGENAPDPGDTLTFPIEISDHTGWSGGLGNYPYSYQPNDPATFNLTMNVLDVNDPPQINISITTGGAAAGGGGGMGIG